MKTIEELANLGAAAGLSRITNSALISLSPEDGSWEEDQPAREAFARAVRDAVLADQPTADVPTWRPIEELPDDEREYAYWDGEMSWHGNPQEKVDATHFIAHPPKPDPFEVWYARWHKVWSEDRNAARIAYDAAREAKP